MRRLYRYSGWLYREAYIRQDLSWLKSYLTMSPKQELIELAEDFPETCSWVIWQDIEAYLDDYDVDVIQEVYEADWDGAGADVDPATIHHYVKDFSDPVVERLNKDIGREVRNEYGGDAPSFLFFGEPELVKNQWLIHFTDVPYEVQQDGFTVGTADLERLGLTVFASKGEKGGGYNFAYSAEDFLQHSSQYGYRKYGAHAVLFRASGLQMWHVGDKERQVVFWGADATDRVVLWHQDKWCTVPCGGGAKLPFCHEDLKTAIQWVMQNFNQYRKQLVCA